MAERLPTHTIGEPLCLPDFDLHHATVLLIASFNHSQGSENVQDWLLEYLHRLHPSVRICEEFRTALKAKARPMLHRLLKTSEIHNNLGHRPVQDDEVELHLDKESHRMQATFNNTILPPHLLTSEALVAKLACEILERDHYWTIERPEGRPNRRLPTRANRSSRWSDPYFSYVVEHALRRRATEAAEYDHLYTQLGEMYNQVLTTENADRKLPTKSYKQLLQILQRDR